MSPSPFCLLGPFPSLADTYPLPNLSPPQYHSFLILSEVLQEGDNMICSGENFHLKSLVFPFMTFIPFIAVIVADCHNKVMGGQKARFI